MNSHKEISYEHYAAKKHEISQGNLTTAQIEHENPGRNSHTKNVQHKASSRIRVRSEKEAGGRTLVKIHWPAKKAISNFMYNQLLSLLLSILPINPPFSRTHSRMHAFSITSSPPTPNL
jgi:hypothetical protein